MPAAEFLLGTVHVLSSRSPGPWPGISDTPIRTLEPYSFQGAPRSLHTLHFPFNVFFLICFLLLTQERSRFCGQKVGYMEIHRESQIQLSKSSSSRPKAAVHRRDKKAIQVGQTATPPRSNRWPGKHSLPRPVSALHQTLRSATQVGPFRLPQGAQEFRRREPASLSTNLRAFPPPPFEPRSTSGHCHLPDPALDPRPRSPNAPHVPSRPPAAQVTPPQTPTPPAAQRADAPT